MPNSLATGCDSSAGGLRAEIPAKDAHGEREIELAMFKQRSRHEEKKCTHIYKHTHIYT